MTQPETLTTEQTPPYVEPDGIAAAELHHVSPFDLHVDEDYQRALNNQMVKAIVAKFDSALFGVLEVNFRDDGTLYVMDGQHRVFVARQLMLPAVPCRIHFGLTSQEEAAMFVRFQSQRRAVTPLEAYRAALHSGDPEYVALDAILHRLGFRVGHAKHNSDNLSRQIPAVATLVRIFRYDEGVVLERALRLYNDAWVNAPGALNGQLLLGLSYLLARKGDDLDDKEFAKKVRGYLPADILRQVRSTQKSTSATVVTQIALYLLGLYNKGRRASIVDGADLLIRSNPGEGGLTEQRGTRTESLASDPRGMSSHAPRRMMEDAARDDEQDDKKS